MVAAVINRFGTDWPLLPLLALEKALRRYEDVDQSRNSRPLQL
jgi:hypothetical protein